jgi:hypothetical protein
MKMVVPRALVETCAPVRMKIACSMATACEDTLGSDFFLLNARRVKCEGLPMETDQTLTTSKTYWKNIKNLFQMSRSGQIKISRD